MEYFDQFGGKLTSQDKKEYARSPQWDGKKFVNLEETKIDITLKDLPKLLKEQFCDTENREPQQALPILPFDREAFLAPADQMKFIWYGHAAVLIRMNDKTLLIDPMLGPNTSPIAPFPTKRYSENTLDLIDEFPPIDAVLFTHDHYDHIDYVSLKKLKPKVGKYFVALGVGKHLRHWGIANEQIVEFDWWEKLDYEGIEVTFTPTRHFSGRGLMDRGHALWGGWSLKTAGENIYFSGDGGYGGHFKEVGEKLGPFDFAFMESGQYNERWRLIHMFPEESIDAAKDVGAKVVMPFHWAAFSLALHTWTDPVERFVAKAGQEGQPYIVPKLGELVEDYREYRSEEWWLS